MAVYFLTAKTGSRGGGQSAAAKCKYIQRQGKYRRGRDHLLHCESGHMPAWAAGRPADYWEAADVHERANGRLFKEVVFALPTELTLEQQQALAREFVQGLTSAEALPYTLAIHSGGGTNPHCHAMLSERMTDGVERPPDQWFRRYNAKAPERGGARKSESLKPRAWLLDTREDWAARANAALEAAGHAARIDARTLEAQGIERLPSVRLGPAVAAMEARGLRTDRGDAARAVVQANAEIAELQAQRAALDREIVAAEQVDEIEAALPAPPPPGAGRRPAVQADTHSDKKERDHGAERRVEAGADARRAGGGDRAVGAGNGEDRGRRGGADRGTAGREPDAGESLVDRADGSGRGVDGDRPRAADRGAGAADRDRPGKGGGDDRGGRSDQASLARRPDSGTDTHSAPRDRILDLARSSPGRRGGPGLDPAGVAAMNRDRTAQAITRQLTAMSCERYDVGIRDAGNGKMMNRAWTGDEVLQNIAWLKRMNARGADIYVRPAEDVSHGLVLLDDLDADGLAALKRDGLAPAAVLETSPDNYQAWIRVGQALPPDQRGALARFLARDYDADPASADARHYGRLAGFTNRKAVHTRADGYQPWVLCRASSGAPAPAGPEMIRRVEDALERTRRDRERSLRLQAIRTPQDSPRGVSVVDEYRAEMARLVGREKDLSRCDFLAAMTLGNRGRGADEIAAAMREASPGLLERKSGHEDDYVERTVRKAMETDKVQAARAAIEDRTAAAPDDPDAPDWSP